MTNDRDPATGGLRQHLIVGAVILAALSVSGCADDEPAAVCSSLDTLEGSIAEVTSVEVEEGVLGVLRDNLTQVQTDLGSVRDEAADEYASEVDAVEESAVSVGSSIEAGITSPSAQALTDIGTAVEALGSSMTALQDAVATTC